MSWGEISTRLAQELNKRMDLAAYSTGLQRSRPLNPRIAAHPANFFFSKAEIPHLVNSLRNYLPGEVANAISHAEEIRQHRISLLGYRAIDYGNFIDWHLDPISGKRAPMKAWFKVRYLDFSEVGDHKVIWELNRHQHLVTLAKAWQFTRNEAYALEVVEELESWSKANPYPMGINWASSLEVAMRSVSWLWIRELLADCEVLPPDFSARLVRGLVIHGQHIERYLSTYFSPNTHLLGEAVGLFFIGTLCPQLPQAGRWQRKGWQILSKEIQRQLRADGVYFEQALYYHVYALDFFLHARVLAARNGIPTPPGYDEKLKQMLEVVGSLAQAGPAEAFGDDDGGRVFNPRRNRTENLSDPLALGAALYGKRDPAGLTEESIWLFGQAALDPSPHPHRCDQPVPRSAAFPAGGIYVLADGLSGTQLMVDAGPQGTDRCGHGHADALEVLLTARGRRWLVDSGTFRYVSDTTDRNLFRGTAAHNTLCVDGLDQAVPDGPFAWASIPSVTVERWIQGESFDFFVGSHDGYARLAQPVTHRRYVFRLSGGIWLVRDVAQGIGTHEIEIFWHFAPDLDLIDEAGRILAKPTAGPASETLGLALLSSADPRWKRRLGTVQLSPAYGLKCSASRISFAGSHRLPIDYAVLLISGKVPLPGEFVRLSGAGDGEFSAFRFQSGNTAHCFLFPNADTWKWGPWASDARFLYYCLEESMLTHLILLDGSFANWQEQSIVKLRRRVDYFERIHRRDGLTISCSQMEAVEHNFEGRLASLDTIAQI